MPTIPSSKQSIDGVVVNQLDSTAYSWADTRNASSGNGLVTVNPGSMSPDAYETSGRGNNYHINRCMLTFDFSGVSGTIVSLHLKLYKASGYTAYKDIIVVKNSNTYSSLAQLSINDYNVDFSTPYSGDFTMGAGGAGTLKTIALNSDAKTDALGNANFTIAICDYDHDYSNVTPLLSLNNYATFYYNQSSYYPRLEYTLDTGFGEIVNGVIHSNISKIIGIGRLNVEKVIDTPYTAISFCSPVWDIGDITTGDSVNITSLINGGTNPGQVQPYVDVYGTKVFVPEYNNKRIRQMSLATGHDLTSTVTDIGVSPALSVYFQMFQMSSNGQKAYIKPINSDNIVEYSLTTAWDITTMATTGTTLSISIPSNEDIRAFHLSNNGNHIYVISAKSSPTVVKIIDIPMSAFDVSTAGTPTVNDITTTGPTVQPNSILPISDNYNDYFLVGSSGTDDTLYINGITNAAYDSQATIPGLGGCYAHASRDEFIYYVKRTGPTNNYTWTLHQLDTNMNFCNLP